MPIASPCLWPLETCMTLQAPGLLPRAATRTDERCSSVNINGGADTHTYIYICIYVYIYIHTYTLTAYNTALCPHNTTYTPAHKLSAYVPTSTRVSGCPSCSTINTSKLSYIITYVTCTAQTQACANKHTHTQSVSVHDCIAHPHIFVYIYTHKHTHMYVCRHL